MTKCEYCKKEIEGEDSEYGWCNDCIDEVLSNIPLMLEYISDCPNNLLQNTLEHDFFVDYCFCANDTEYSQALTLLCKKRVTNEIELGNEQYKHNLLTFISDDLSSYLDWIEKKEKSEFAEQANQSRIVCQLATEKLLNDAAFMKALDTVKGK